MISVVLVSLVGTVSGLHAAQQLPRSASSGDLTSLALSGAVLALIVVQTPLTVTLVALHGIWVLLPLAVIDAATGRLPRARVLRSFLPTAVLTLGASAFGGWPSVAAVLAGTAAVWLTFLALFAVNGIGAGDVRLAPVVGAHLAVGGLDAVWIGVASSFILGAAWLAIGRLRRQHASRDRVPFGPALLGGVVIGLALAGVPTG